MNKQVFKVGIKKVYNMKSKNSGRKSCQNSENRAKKIK